MRTHLLGWVILGLAVCAPPLGSLDTPRQVEEAPGIGVPAGAAERPSGTPPPVVLSAAIARRDIVDVPSPLASSPTPAAAPTQPAAGVAVGAALSFVTNPALPVREFAPGSKAHSDVIAENIASQEFQDAVTPLARLYLAYFGRVPDYEGFDYYIGERERGESLEAIADEFAGSAEFNARYGALDHGAFVERVHQNIFGAPASAEARAYWVDQIESGRLTRGQVMLIFSESPGFVAMTDSEVFVAIAYAEALGRAPDPADLSRWVRFLDAGNPRRAVIDQLLADRGKG